MFLSNQTTESLYNVKDKFTTISFRESLPAWSIDILNAFAGVIGILQEQIISPFCWGSPTVTDAIFATLFVMGTWRSTLEPEDWSTKDRLRRRNPMIL